MLTDNSKTVFQIGLDSARAIVHPRKHTQRVSEKLEQSRKTFAEAQALINRAAIIMGDCAMPELLTLCDSIRFSDPVGTVDSVDAEQQLLELSRQIEQASTSGAIPIELLEQAHQQLRLRNFACKQK